MQKGVLLYEFMHNWEIFNETSLPEKEDFYSHLNMENINDADYTHTKRVWKDFKIRNLGGYHDLYVQNNTLLLADVSENFRNMCLKIYELDLARFFTAPGLAWQAVLKKTKLKLILLADIDMLLSVEKGIRWGTCHAIYRYAKANNKYMKDYGKNKKLSYLKYWDINNLYGWAMSQKLPVNDSNWVEDCSYLIDDGIEDKKAKSKNVS